MPETQKGLAYQLAAGAIRWKGYFDWIISHYTKKHIPNDTRYLLWTSLYQVSFMQKAPYHVVNEVVSYTKQKKGERVANFVNAILRRYLRDRDALLDGVSSSLSTDSLPIRYSFPPWIAERWERRFGRDETVRLFSVLNQTPGFSLRVNTGKITVEEAARELEESGIKTRPGTILQEALRVDKLAKVLRHQLFQANIISVQDETSQLAALALLPGAGQKVLDACAGSGTKTHHILDVTNGTQVVSMDNERGKLALVRNRGNCVLGDALFPPFSEGVFDAILVDAPCSSLGIIRKHPEIKWHRKERDIAFFSDLQVKIVNTLWGTLKTGGHMVYSVCSFEPEETTDVVKKLEESRKFILENPFPFLFNKEYFVSLPHETGMDGFFIARLRKI